MMLRTLLPVGLLIASLTAAPLCAQEDLLNPEYLRKVAGALAADGRASQIYAFVENEFPEFSSILRKAGFADLLDGRLSASEFEARWRVQRAIYETEGGRLGSPALDGLYVALQSALLSRPSAMPAPEWSVATMLSRNRLDHLRERMYDASRHALSSWSRMHRVEMAEVPGKLLWFNPDIAVPELGIRPGVALSAEQEAAIVKLFSIRIAEEVPGRARMGTASYPADVGRSVNTATKALTIVDGNGGDILGELTLKGTGLNPETPGQRIWNSGSPIGHLETDEGLTDSEVALRLRRALVNAYAPVAVIDVSEIPGAGMTRAGRCVYVRASESLVRYSPHLDRDPSGGRELADLKLLLEVTAREAGLNHSGRPMGVKEWAETILPARHGRNAGITAEIGFHHTNHNGNIGPGVVMDFGEAELFGRANGAGDTGWYKTTFVGILKAIQRVLPPGEVLDTDKAARGFDAALDEGRRMARLAKPRIRVSDRVAPRLDGEELGHLLTGYELWISRQLSQGTPESLEILTAEFRKWRIPVPQGQALTGEWMAGRIRARFAELAGWPHATAESKRKALEIIGGTEAQAPLEALRARPIEDLRARAAALGIAEPCRFNRSRLIRLLADATSGGQANRSADAASRGSGRARFLAPYSRRADPATDALLKEVLLRMEAWPEGRLAAEAIRRGRIEVRWTNFALLGGRPAEFDGRIVFADRTERLDVLAPEVACEATGAYNTLRGRWSAVLGSQGRREAREAGKFAAAYLLKEGVTALASRDGRRLEGAARGMATAEFWTGLAIFTGASRVTERSLATPRAAARLGGRGGTLVRGALPLTAGMAAVEAAGGAFDPVRFGVSTSAFFGGGLAVNAVADRALAGALRAVSGTGVGRIAGAAFTVTKLAAVLAIGDQADRAVEAARR